MHGDPLPATSTCSATPSPVEIFLGPLWTTTGLAGAAGAAAAGSSRRTAGLLWHAPAPAVTARATHSWIYATAERYEIARSLQAACGGQRPGCCESRSLFKSTARFHAQLLAMRDCGARRPGRANG